mgnify:FL=1
MDFIFYIMPIMISDYTKEELLKKLKTQKILFIAQTAVILLMIVLAVFSTASNGVSYQTFLPLFFIPMAVVMWFEMKKIKKELAKRT